MPGGGQPKQGLNNVAQMHTHESHVSGRGVTAWPAGGSALWECKTKQMDYSHLCGLPLVTHWEMFPYCIEEHQLLHWSREGSLGYSIYLILVFSPPTFLPNIWNGCYRKYRRMCRKTQFLGSMERNCTAV